MFVPGETIIHQFYIPFPQNEVTSVILSYKQNDDVVMEREITTARWESSESCYVIYEFTQSDSLLFSDDIPFSVELNVMTAYGSRFTSQPIEGKIGEQYYREVM